LERLRPMLIAFALLLPLESAASQTIDLTTRPLSQSFSYAALQAAAPLSVVPASSWHDRALGQQIIVDVINPSLGMAVSASVRLVAAADQVYLWAEDSVPHSTDRFGALAARIRDELIPSVNNLWETSSAPIPVHIVFTAQIGDGLDAYYQYQPFDELSGPRIVVNAARFSALDDPLLWSRLAHEYQHLLRHHDIGAAATWLDEGYSVYTEQALALSDNMFLLRAFYHAPQTPLMTWGGTLADYGASLSFISYVEGRFGSAARRALSREIGHGYQALQRALGQRVDVETLLADWVLEALLSPSQPLAVNAERINRLPHNTRGALAQTGTQVLRLDAPTVSTLQLDFTPSTDAALLFGAACGENRFMMALPVDNSRANLTAAFDLAAVDDPVLHFDLWYDLERHWDYAYVSASVDGQTWVDLTSPMMTTANPYRRARAAGYTGQSDGWVSDAVDLSPFAGHQVLVRFQALTDESTTHSGIALDNVRLGSDGAAQTFDAEPIHWQSDGWAQVDGCLPQRTWVQIVQRAGAEQYLTRILTDRAFSQEIALQPNAEAVFIAITPATPYVTAPLVYTLTVR
jgi:immune inhibitor A